MKISFANVKKSNTIMDYISQLPIKVNKNNKNTHGISSVNNILQSNGIIYNLKQIFKNRIITNMSGFIFKRELSVIIPYKYEYARLSSHKSYNFVNIRYIEINGNKISTKFANNILLLEDIVFCLKQIYSINSVNSLSPLMSVSITNSSLNQSFSRINPLSILNGRASWVYLIQLYKKKRKLPINENDYFPYDFIDRYIECNKKYWLVREKTTNKNLILSEDTLNKKKSVFKNTTYETIY